MVNNTLMRRPSAAHVANAKLGGSNLTENTMSASWRNGAFAAAAAILITAPSAYADFSIPSPLGPVNVSTNPNPFVPRVTPPPVSVQVPGVGTAVVRGPSVGGIVPSTPSVQLPGETGELGKLMNTIDTVTHAPEIGQQKAAEAIDKGIGNIIDSIKKPFEDAKTKMNQILDGLPGILQNAFYWAIGGIVGTILLSVLISSLIVSLTLRRSTRRIKA